MYNVKITNNYLILTDTVNSVTSRHPKSIVRVECRIDTISLIFIGTNQVYKFTYDQITEGIGENTFADKDAFLTWAYNNTGNITQSLSITDTFTVANEAAMLALVAETGDVAVRTDESKTYILQGTDPSVLGDWQELLTPTDTILSVNSLTGSVQLDLGFTGSTGILTLTGSPNVDLGFTTTDTTNWDTAYSWGDWSTGVDKSFVDALNVDANTLGGQNSAYHLDRANHTGTQLANTIFDFTNSAQAVVLTTVDKIFVDDLNVDADTLDGQEGTYYLDFNNLTNLPTILSGYGISDTKANFNTALSDGSFMFIGDAPTSHTHPWSEVTATPTTLSGYGISDTKANFDTALSDGSFMFVGDTPTAHTIESHSDVTLTTIGTGELLKWNGSVWINNTLAEAGISAVGHTHTNSEITDFSAGVTGIIDKTFVDALNVDADTLDNQDGTYYLDFGNATNTPTTLSGYGISDIKANFNTALSDGTFMFTGDAPTAHTIESHSDVTLTTIDTGEILKWNGTIWVNNTLAEAGISATGHTHTNSEITDFSAGVSGIVDKTFVDALNVDADTLDTLNSTQFLRSDTDDTFDGKLSIKDSADADTLDLSHDVNGGRIDAPVNVRLEVAGVAITDARADQFKVYQDITQSGGQSIGTVGTPFINAYVDNFYGGGGNITGVDAANLGGQNSAYHLAWANFTGTPTTLAGYGITDAGDMLLASVQSVTGLKTFDKDKLAMKGTSTGVTTVSTANTGASNYTLTLPDITDTVVTKTSTDVLTNKTLTSPVINTPTGIVKGDVGLGNVDNTSDATKDAAVATLTNKTLTSPVINTPTGIVKGDVGLGNVDNTSDATKNSATATLTNKTITKRVLSESGNPATLSIDSDDYDFVKITSQVQAITISTGTETPTIGQTLWITITASSGTSAITWDAADFEDSTITAPTAMSTTRQDVGFVWNDVTSKWRCVAKS